MLNRPLELPLGPLMVDVGGRHLATDETVFLAQPAIGGVILFSRNYQSREQVSALINEIKSIRTPSLLIAVDQEGGRVQRFKNEFTRLPAAYQFGDVYTQDPQSAIELCCTAGCLMAAELRQVGIDFSFAPVLDCANLHSNVIGNRGFHQQPTIIVKLASAFIDGMQQAGMVATGKHFPGHGGVTADSHLTLPIDKRTLEEIADYDLIPYKNLAKKLAGIMTAHIHFPKIDADLPTFSTFWLNTTLRQEIGFNGLIFSDDLSMQGACTAGNAMQRTKSALQAGCDMALICNDHDSALSVADELGTSWQAHQPRLLAMQAQSAERITEADMTILKNQLSLGGFI